MQGPRLRLRRVSGWTTTGVPVIIGLVSVIGFPVAIAALVGLSGARIPWSLICLAQAIIAVGGIGLSIPIYRLMMAKSPTFDLSLEGSTLTLSRKGRTISRIDLSLPHRCAVLVVLDTSTTKVLISQGETEISFEQPVLPPESFLFLPFCLATRKRSFYGDAAYEFLPVGWKPGMTVVEGDLMGFMSAVSEFCRTNQILPQIVQRKG